MIIKQHLPFRYSREGCIPDRILLRPCAQNREECRNELEKQKKTAHFHLSAEGTVTALTPLSAAANLLGPTGIDPAPQSKDLPHARRGILILIEGEGLKNGQKEPLIRLLKGIQKEFFRIYGEVFPFRRSNLICDPTVYCAEELLEEGIFCPEDLPRFRVQTGSYRDRREAERKVEALCAAGIAAYVTEVRSG